MGNSRFWDDVTVVLNPINNNARAVGRIARGCERGNRAEPWSSNYKFQLLALIYLHISLHSTSYKYYSVMVIQVNYELAMFLN